MMMILGVFGSLLLLPGPRTIGSVFFDINTLLYAVMAVVLLG